MQHRYCFEAVHRTLCDIRFQDDWLLEEFRWCWEEILRRSSLWSRVAIVELLYKLPCRNPSFGASFGSSSLLRTCLSGQIFAIKSLLAGCNSCLLTPNDMGRSYYRPVSLASVLGQTFARRSFQTLCSSVRASRQPLLANG